MVITNLFINLLVANNVTMMAKGKSRKKYNAKSALIVKQLAGKYEVSEAFVRMSISGDRVSETAELIKKDYNRLYKAIDNVFK